MISKTELKEILINCLDYLPTKGQNELLDRLISFIFCKDPNSVFVLKGYAGTGKTTIISTLVNTISILKLRSELLAPTGRAAKVISSYSGKPAFTIHKKIYFAKPSPDGSIKVTLQQNIHKNTLFVVDEASMIPDHTRNENFSFFSYRNLLEDLIEYVHSGVNCKLLLVGDTAQLPPVGLNLSPALDLSYLKAAFGFILYTYTLTEVVRQSIDSGILQNATAIRNKIRKELISFPFFNTHTYNDVEAIDGTQLEESLNFAYSNYGSDNTIIITRSNKRAGLFNKEIRNRILYRESVINAGDVLMIVKNNYYWLGKKSSDGFIANGDLVEILRVKNHQDLYGFKFADLTIRMIDYPQQKEIDVKVILNSLDSETSALSRNDEKTLFNEIMLDYEDEPQKRKRTELVKKNPYFNALQIKFAYALTCHKTQGGQWPAVFIDQGYMTDEMINIEYLRWLYTAITRATKKVFLINFQDKFFES